MQRPKNDLPTKGMFSEAQEVSPIQPASRATVQLSPIPTIVTRGMICGHISRVFGLERLIAGA